MNFLFLFWFLIINWENKRNRKININCIHLMASCPLKKRTFFWEKNFFLGKKKLFNRTWPWPKYDIDGPSTVNENQAKPTTS